MMEMEGGDVTLGHGQGGSRQYDRERQKQRKWLPLQANTHARRERNKGEAAGRKLAMWTRTGIKGHMHSLRRGLCRKEDRQLERAQGHTHTQRGNPRETVSHSR